jgi:glutamine amidotransferase-like uncharacterized protein
MDVTSRYSGTFTCRYLKNLGNLEGICSSELFGEKRVPFLDPEDIKILSLEAIWNFSKEHSSPELISDYGAQRACLQGLGASGL